MAGTANSIDEALDEVNGYRRSRLPRWAQNAIGAVVGASLIGFPVAWLSDRDRNSRVDHTLELLLKAQTENKEKFKKIEEFHKWPRFTEQDADDKLLPLSDDIEDIKDDHEDLQRMQNRLDQEQRNLLRAHYELRAEFEGLPPEVWQERIVNIEKEIAELKGTIKK